MIIAREIHRALRVLQIKNRRVRKGAELPVAVAGSHILVELHAGGELSVNDLAAALMIPQSQVSRILQKLRARRFVLQRQDPKDSRRALSSLSQAGLMVIHRIDEVIGGIFQECFDRISKDEANELTLFFERVAHGLGCEHIRRRKHEDRLRAAHRQMARVFGLLGANVYHSDLTRSQWAIFEALFNAPEPLNATILEGYLGVKPAVISEILNRYELHGYIERIRSKTNHRINLIHLTREGRRYFKHLETAAVVRLQRVLRGIPIAGQKRILTLLHRFAGEWGASSIFLGRTLVTERITEPSSLAEARAFTFREIVRLRWEGSAPDPLFPRGHEVWGLFDGTPGRPELRAVCVVAEENRSWAVTLCCWSEHMQLNQSIAFVQHAHYLSNRRRTPAPLAIRFEPFERLFPKAGW